MIWQGKAKRLEDVDLPMIGYLIGVGEDEVHAILDVEAAGSGFDSKGRLKMLFEPHVFWRQLSDKLDKRVEAVAKGLAYANWRPGNYPPDSYPRLEQAIAIDRVAALKSASWGLGQIMGYNHALCGYETVEAMITDFAEDEDNHLEAMIRFIKATRIDDELRRHDWANFARVYNGPGYAANGYDKKLAAAYLKWSKIKDTPWSPNEATTAPPPVSAIPIAPTPEKPAQGPPNVPASQSEKEIPMSKTNLITTLLFVASAVMAIMTQLLGCTTDAAGASTCSASWLTPQLAVIATGVFSVLGLLSKMFRPGGALSGLFGSTAVVVPEDKAGVGTVTKSQVMEP
jgi:hypothetical protein